MQIPHEWGTQYKMMICADVARVLLHQAHCCGCNTAAYSVHGQREHASMLNTCWLRCHVFPFHLKKEKNLCSISRRPRSTSQQTPDNAQVLQIISVLCVAHLWLLKQ